MKILLGLIIGILIGAGVVWYYHTSDGRTRMQSAGDQLESAGKSTRDVIQEKLRVLDLRSNDIKDELAKTGQVIRRKSKEAGKAIADATADARITAAIKGKLLTDRELSAVSISVNTTEGVVTLSGTVTNADLIGKAMLLAMETDGVREVVSTLQVSSKK
jgi:hypothetical protein